MPKGISSHLCGYDETSDKILVSGGHSFSLNALSRQVHGGPSFFFFCAKHFNHLVKTKRVCVKVKRYRDGTSWKQYFFTKKGLTEIERQRKKPWVYKPQTPEQTALFLRSMGA